jgi:hypothetical protein
MRMRLIMKNFKFSIIISVYQVAEYMGLNIFLWDSNLVEFIN